MWLLINAEIWVNPSYDKGPQERIFELKLVPHIHWWRIVRHCMMASWPGNAFGISDLLWGESAGHWCIPIANRNRNIDNLFLLALNICWINIRFTVLLKWHYTVVTAMAKVSVCIQWVLLHCLLTQQNGIFPMPKLFAWRYAACPNESSSLQQKYGNVAMVGIAPGWRCLPTGISVNKIAGLTLVLFLLKIFVDPSWL